MGKQIELKRLILDFNTLVASLNKAEEYFKKCTDVIMLNIIYVYKLIRNE